jgi:23S rRNA pseudouridine2605 synthase
MSDPQRLNKLLASHLGIGRRAADDLIEKGKVIVNGDRARLGQQVSTADTITVNGAPLVWSAAPALTYLLLHKPIGYVCSRRQQGDAPTIYSLLPAKYHHLQPVGRLDKDSSGLLLLTNDGDFALKMTHPSFGKTKEYEITLDTPLTPLHRQLISDIGVTLPDGPSRLQLERLKEGNDTKWRVLMHEGRNRQIRRTFAALGYKVTQLHRTRFGTFSLDVASGKYKEVQPSKVQN